MHTLGGTLEELLKIYYLAKRKNLPAKGHVISHYMGGHQSRLRGRGIDFSETRNYQPGDDTRLMDWRITARTGKPHTKVFHEEKQRPTFIVVDQSATMQFGSVVTFKSILAAQIAAYLAWAGLHHGDRVGGFIYDGHQHYEFRPQNRRNSLLPFIEKLANVCQPRKINKASSPMMSLTLQRLQQVAKPGSLIYLISDFYDLNQQTFCPLQQILAHCEIRALKIYDPLEKDAPPPDNYQVSDGKQEIYWDTNDRKGCQQFKNQYSEQHQILKNELSNLQIPLISVATNENWSERLSRAFYHWSDQPCLGI